MAPAWWLKQSKASCQVCPQTLGMASFHDFTEESFELLPENVQLNLCVEAIYEHETRDPDYIRYVLLHQHWGTFYESTTMWLKLGLESVW